MKKILKLLNCIVIITLLINITSSAFFAEDNDTIYTEADIQYIIENNSVVIIKYNGSNEEIRLPFSIGNYEVRGIKAGAFVGTAVKKIEIFNNMNVTGIEKGAFNNGVEIHFIDASGEEESSHTINNEQSSNQSTDHINGEQDQFDTLLVNEDGEIIVEDINTDIVSDIEDNDENESIPLHIKIQNYLFDGSKFASDFESNPIGYIFIAISACVMIFIIYRYLVKKH